MYIIIIKNRNQNHLDIVNNIMIKNLNYFALLIELHYVFIVKLEVLIHQEKMQIIL